MGNAATTKKGDSTESGEYLTLGQTCWKWFKCERVNEEQVLLHVFPLSDKPFLCFLERGES